MSSTEPFIGYIYVIGSEVTDKYNLRKIGETGNPIRRMQQFMTGDPPGIGYEKNYQGIWETIAKNKQENKAIENHIHICLKDKRKKRADGGTSEWFEVSFEEVENLIDSLKRLISCRLSIEDIKVIHKKANTQEIIHTPLPPSFFTLYEQFCSVFIPGGIPRSIQKELWKIMETKCKSTEPIFYRGIVQWPTGVGKTIATLMMIVLIADRCKRLGIPYRGLFISPKNDILDTICKNFKFLETFGITFIDGSHGQLNKVNLPKEKSILVSACQKILTEEDTLTTLPPMQHIHYDEVHRVTGEEFFQLLTKFIDIWKTEFVIGTSATPKTCSPAQHKKLEEIFGNPLQILHRCEVDEAVREKWIAPPRFLVNILPKCETKEELIARFVDSSIEKIQSKGRKGKHILYIETGIEYVKAATLYAIKRYPEIEIYSAIDGERTDDTFIIKPLIDKQQILFACQRYREGSDIAGLESVCTLLGSTISPHTLLQVCGRAMRLDYPEKEGWCILAKECKDSETAEDILSNILFEIATFEGKTDVYTSKEKIKRFIESYIGDITVLEHKFTIEETIQRIQSLYIRREFTERTSKEKYGFIRELNRELSLSKREEYFAMKKKHPRFIESPKEYFKDEWQSWYHFLGVDTSIFPQTKAEWICVCKEKGFYGKEWAYYQANRDPTLPEIPGHMYEDFTNWDSEMGVEEELVW